MIFVGLGLILIGLKVFEYGFVAAWSWPLVLSPFGVALAWWWYADKAGLTAAKTMAREEQRRLDRIERNRANMGIPGRPKGK